MPKRKRTVLTLTKMQLQNKRRLRAESSLQRQSQIAGGSAEVRAVAIDEGCLNKTDSNNDFNAFAHAFESSTDVLLPDIGNTPSSSRAGSVVSEQEHKQRLARAKATARAAESEVARSLRQKKDAVAKSADRASESEMQRQLRLNRNAETTANARASETTDERLSRLGEHGDSRYDVSSLSRSESGSSSQSMQHGGMPELFLGLSYNGTTGRLMVEVVKGSNFRNMAMNRAPDTYVKLTLMSPTGKEIARSKTSIRRGQPNPLFRETFVFQVALFQLPELTLMISVYNKRSMKRKEMIGWFALGMKSSGEEEQSHWNDMCENKGEEVQRWHVLLES
ncbi:synaptotagmin-14-like isoform X5 [Octopus vulgaris]|uniref:Synaptotagmin-14-like isoform X5 n=1 Tax=Octopus vulgaris TaxID=6645 RepID=A0AA36BLB1_OCTVU|nr:synaptotagmin-14-like isoform X5 [Octopus vulgaris]